MVRTFLQEHCGCIISMREHPEVRDLKTGRNKKKRKHRIGGRLKERKNVRMMRQEPSSAITTPSRFKTEKQETKRNPDRRGCLSTDRRALPISQVLWDPTVFQPNPITPIICPLRLPLIRNCINLPVGRFCTRIQRFHALTNVMLGQQAIGQSGIKGRISWEKHIPLEARNNRR